MIDAFSIEHGMEQTSMTNTIKKRLDRKGFTLAEVLVTVAIILILAGVTFGSVAQYQKNLRLMEMDGTAKEIFIAAQNHLSVAQASGDLDRLAEDAKKSATGTTASPIGTKLDSNSVSAYAGNADGEYYSVIHNVTNGSESCTPSGSDTILGMMLPFGALDETVATGGNYAIVYELKSASVVAVLYSGAGNASFGNAAVINFGADDVSKIKDICNDKSARKNYVKNGVTAIVGCYTGTAGSAAIPTETLEAPKLEVKNENKLHVIVREAKNTDNITLVITGEQSGTTARGLLNRNSGADDGYKNGTFDVTLDDITGDGKYRFSQLIKEGRFTPDVAESDFIPGENIIISAIASSTTALATPKESAKYTVSSLFDDVNETTNSTGDTKVYIKNLRHLENLGANVSDFTAALGKDTTSGHYNVVNITAVQKNDITMFSFNGLRGETYNNIYGSGTFTSTYIAANVDYPLSYDGGYHEIYDLMIAGYHKDNVEANAGIFGTVTNALSVKNLVLRNDKIPYESSSANAGMLLGKTNADLTVDGVLAYYHEDEYNSKHDSAVEVQASQVAGGLIGLVDGGKLSVKNSAAAVYVKGGSAAGGFIGSVSDVEEGSTIVQSYAGGHTRDGAYDTEVEESALKIQSAGRYNVQASGYAGGFIGVTTNNVTMNAVYSTASAYSTDVNKSASFSGNTETNFGTAKNYYAIGPHNGTDASADDTAKAEIKTGQVRRQATPYDRKLLVKDTETEHKTMDKTSYPLCTVRNLCEGDASVKDTDLPWFIKEHVGDWLVHKESGKAGFEIENGNRLTVRIHTGLATITQPLLYKIKVHGESSNQDIYFNVEVKSDNTVTVKRENSDGNLVDISEIAECITLDGTQAVQFYLDDITRKNGHFYTVCARLLCPGEDITVNVAPAEKSVVNNSVKYIADFKNENQLRTNSLFGYLEKSEKGVTDKHISQKIKAVTTYYPNAGNENGLGLIPVKDEYGNGAYYVQIDNSRHLENLSSPVGYDSKKDIVQKITGAVQTDNIYWKGWDENNTKDTFTEGFIEELGQNNRIVNVYNDKGENELSTDNHFSPISLNESLKMYDGAGYKISGLDAVEQNGYAALFTKIVSAATIKNLVLENASFKSDSPYTAGLIAYAGAAVDIDKVKFTECLNINGRTTAAGFVAYAANSITINDSGIENGNIKSTNEMAAGLVAYAGQTGLISNVKCTGILNVSGYSETGGFVGSARNSITVSSSCIEKGDICSTSGNAGGLIAYAGMDASLSDITVGNKDWNKEDSISTFHVQSNGKTSENASAGALIARAAGVSTIKNVHLNLNLAVENTSTDSFNAGQDAVGGLIGCACAKVYIEKSGLKNGNITSTGTRAGGLIGFAQNEVSIEQSEITNGVITSENDRAGGLVAHTTGNTTFDGVYCDTLMVTGKSTTGGFLGFSPNTVVIKNAEVNNCTVSSTHEQAGGLIALGSNVNISNVNIKGTVSVTAKQAAGGFGGYNTQQLSIAKSSIHSAVVNSAATYSGGFFGYTGGNTTINDTDLLSDSLITSETSDAGGVIGHSKSGVNITNTKIIGSNTEIIAKTGNAGGLIGGFENSGLTISNSAVAAFVNSKNGNAGGLIGNMNGAADGSQISNSFYGGRTVKGAYGTNIVYKGTVNEHNYAANIIAKNSAGGLIGSIVDGRNLTLIRDFSTGSVQAEAGSIGGFIGYIGTAGNMKIQECYSIGAVTAIGDNPNRSVGGFIGKTSDGTPAFNSSYYLNWFNSPTLKAIGNDTHGTYNSITIDNAEAILGNTESKDLTSEENTHFYDETLAGHHYPYKNWTNDMSNITYYGDWPLQKNLVGEFVYFHAISGVYKNGGYFRIAGDETEFDGYLTPYNTNLQKSGFGIFSDTLFLDDDVYNKIKNRFKWSQYSSGPFDGECKFEGKNATKYSVVHYQGKEYYFYRCTSDALEEVENGTLYVNDTEKNLYYKITLNGGNATFEPYILPAG